MVQVDVHRPAEDADTEQAGTAEGEEEEEEEEEEEDEDLEAVTGKEKEEDPEYDPLDDIIEDSLARSKRQEKVSFFQAGSGKSNFCGKRVATTMVLFAEYSVSTEGSES